jgi:ABC-type metal ion transport system substrate-binding protein
MHVGKTLKMLGINFMQKENETNSAEHYLKRALKVLQEQGNAKLVKEVKSKLAALKDIKERRINGMIHQD